MVQENYPYLDLTVLPEIRTHVIAPNAVVLFSQDLSKVLWANGEGTRLLGAPAVRNLLEDEVEFNPAMMRQIAVAVDKLNQSDDAAAIMRVSMGFKTRLIGFTVRKIDLPRGENAILLLTESLYGRSHTQLDMARSAVDCLDGYSNASAILDQNGIVFAASEHFKSLNVAEDDLKSLAVEVLNENDRLVKRPIQTAKGAMPAGIARLTDNPASHILVITNAGDTAEKAPVGDTPKAAVAEASAPAVEEAEEDAAPAVGAFSNRRQPLGGQANKWYYKAQADTEEEAVQEMPLNAEPEIEVKAEAPVKEIPEVEAPTTDTQIAEAPVAQEQAAEEHAVEEQAAEAPLQETPSADAPISEAPEKKTKIDSSFLIQETEHTETSPSSAAIAMSEIGIEDEETEDAFSTEESDEGFRFVAGSKPVRFVWEIDANHEFRSVSDELAATVGSQPANIEGLTWEEIGQLFSLENADDVSELLTKQDTWSGKTVLWPVQGTDLRVPIDLAGLPSYDRDRQFAGFNGFGIIRTADAVMDPDFGENDDEAEFVTNDKNEDNIEDELAEEAAQVDRSLSSDEQASFQKIGKKLTDKAENTPEPAVSTDEKKTNEIGFIPSAFAKSNTVEPKSVTETKTPVEISTAVEAQDETQPAKTNIPDHNVDTSILARLPIPVLVYRENDLLFGNRKFFDLTGYDSLQDLAEAGGVDALFGSSLLEAENSQAQIFHREGNRLDVHAHLQRVPWDENKAMLLTLRQDDGKRDPDPFDNRSPDHPANRKAELQSSAPSGPTSVLGRVATSEPVQKTSVTPLRPVKGGTKLKTTQQVEAFGGLDPEDLRSILDTATDGIVILSDEGIVRAINRSAEALFDIEPEFIVDRNFTRLLAPESHRSALDYVISMSGTGVSSILNDGREVIGKTSNGGLIPLFMTIGKMAKTNACCAVVRDITQWKKTEEELITAKSEAELANEQKTEFLTKVSHEIRTPLNAIIGFSNLMISERFGKIDSERYRSYLRDINHSGTHMLDLINDLLDISKIEAGKMELEFDACDLGTIISETVAITQPDANKERVIIRTSLSSAVPKVVADPRSLKQIILNLVSNSIKYTKSGGQVIVSTVYEEGGEVVLRVRDTGVGMNEMELAKALKPFQQVGGKEDNSKQGTGLGLPLTKAMVEANRAKFHIESKSDEGTLVEIRFPSQRVLAE